jgi:hypothetical protein
LMVSQTNARNNFVDVAKKRVRLVEYEKLSAKRHVARIDVGLPAWRIIRRNQSAFVRAVNI